MERMTRLAGRLPKAVLVALLTALVFGGLLGTAQAADGTSGDVPETLAVPAPRVGDRWTYQALLEGRWLVAGNDSQDGVAVGRPFPYAEFAWLEPTVVRGAGGAEVSVDRLESSILRYRGPDESPYSDWEWSGGWYAGWGDWFSTTDFSDADLWIPSREVLLLRSGTTEGVAREAATESYGDGDAGSNLTIAPGVPVRTWDVETITGWGRTFEAVEVPCLSRWSGQGTQVALGGLRVPDDCLPGAEGGFVGDSAGYEPAGIETVAGYSAVRLDGQDSSLWLSPQLPVPVQWSARDGDQVVTVTLTSWTSGSAPLGVPLSTASGLAPPIEFAPRQLWGPDDSGVDHPFPASAAFMGALGDPTWPDLRDWMDQHPGAFTYLLEYNEDRGEVPLERQWLFALTDGEETWAFVATQSEALASPLPGLPAARAVRYEEAGWTSQVLDVLAPDPDVVPAQLPTVASTLARWEAYEASEGRSEPANGWGMVLHCPVGCIGIEALLAWIGSWSGPAGGPWSGSWGSWADWTQWIPDFAIEKVGYADVVAGRDPIALMRVEDAGGNDMAASLPGTTTSQGSQLTVDGAGLTTRHIQWSGTSSSGAAVGPLSTQDTVAVAATEPGGGDGGVKRALAGFIPSPGQGAAIAAAGSLAGLLYWLWPTVKGGVATLFSRVTGPKLLEHPARARLVQLVQAEPGVHFQDLVRRSGLPNGTAVHHLRKLADAGLVAARPLGRYTCYFPGSSPDRASLAAAPVTRSDGARRILAELSANPGLSGTDLALRLGLQASTVTYHVKRLQEAGLVAAARDGRVIRLRALATG